MAPLFRGGMSRRCWFCSPGLGCCADRTLPHSAAASDEQVGAYESRAVSHRCSSPTGANHEVEYFGLVPCRNLAVRRWCRNRATCATFHRLTAERGTEADPPDGRVCDGSHCVCG